MEDINLDKYKSAWKAEQSFDEEKLSRERIMAFMGSASKSISGLFRKSLIFDIIIKSLLAFSSGGLLLLYSDQGRLLPVIAATVLLVIICIVLQVRTYRRIPGAKDSGQNTRALLHSFVDFYSRSFVPSLITASLTGPLILVVGSLYYFFFKYGTVPPLELADHLVFGTFILISFLLSAFVQVKNFNFHIGQLKESLSEIEQDTLTDNRLRYYRKVKNRNMIIYSIILLAGLLLLILFII
jgi:hypothetical protein